MGFEKNSAKCRANKGGVSLALFVSAFGRFWETQKSDDSQNLESKIHNQLGSRFSILGGIWFLDFPKLSLQNRPEVETNGSLTCWVQLIPHQNTEEWSPRFTWSLSVAAASLLPFSSSHPQCLLQIQMYTVVAMLDLPAHFFFHLVIPISWFIPFCSVFCVFPE